jgi:hypothetical protein
MVVTNEKVGIEDELEILSALAKQGRFVALFPGECGPKTTEFREGPFIEVVSRSVIFPTSLTVPNLESWNSEYK